MEELPHTEPDSVELIFRGIAGDRATMLCSGRFPEAIREKIASALSSGEPDAEMTKNADEVAFHLTDWCYDAAFLAALHLYPERFTPDEIRENVEALLLHVPHHILAAARLGGFSTKDIFLKP